MARIKGSEKTGGGSRKGIKNHVTNTVKDTYENAFIMLQTLKGHDLISWAKENKTDFYKLAIRLIPQEVEAKVTQRIERVEIVINDKNNTSISLTENDIVDDSQCTKSMH